MRKEEIFQQIRGKLIVSCQANEEENPFNPPEEMTRMAKAAAIGGCAGFRANRPENVRMIKEAFPDKVMIGIWKVVTEGCDVYILSLIHISPPAETAQPSSGELPQTQEGQS